MSNQLDAKLAGMRADKAVARALGEVLGELAYMDDGDRDAASLPDLAGLFEEAAVASYEDDGVLTMNEGLVVRLADGREVQITIVESGGGW